MKIAITADSTCDIPKELLEQYNIETVPLYVIMGDNEYREGQINSQDIYAYVEKNKMLPKTAAVSSYEYKEIFERKLKEFDAVIHFSLSFEISSTGENAKRAAAELENVYVIDTKSLSSGSGLLVLSCADKIKENKTIEQIINELLEEREKIQASFLIPKLDYLKKGGRCSAVSFLSAKILGLKVFIRLQEGKMEKGGIYKGKFSSCLSKYLNDIIKNCPPDLNRVFITYSSQMDGIKENVVKEVEALGFREVIQMNAGATICSHCGPDTIGVLYMQK